METEPKDTLILDIPVIHQGYLNLLERQSPNIKTLFLLREEVLDDLGMPREIRAVGVETTRRLLYGLNFPFNIGVLNLDMLRQLPPQRILTARDEVSRRLREKFFPNAMLTQESIFLRWDESNVTSTRPVNVDEETDAPYHLEMMKRARMQAESSSDWWRQVGVVVARDGQVLVEAYNQALPTDQKPYIDGNPRDFIKAGTLQFLSSTIHAEAAAIAKAAGRELSLKGADLYLNSFPCPPCSTAMGLAGIKRCYFSGGNAYLDAADVLKAVGIKTIFVNDSSNQLGN